MERYSKVWLDKILVITLACQSGQSAKDEGFFLQIKGLIKPVNDEHLVTSNHKDTKPAVMPIDNTSGHLSNKVEIKEQAEHAYKPWSEDEEVQLIDLFMDGLSINEIAKRHQRQYGAIRSRLKKLRFID